MNKLNARLFLIFFFLNKEKRNKAHKECRLNRQSRDRRGASPSEGTKKTDPFLTFVHATRLRQTVRGQDGLGHRTFSATSRGSGRIIDDTVFTTTPRESRRDVVFSPSWNDARMNTDVYRTHTRTRRISGPAFAEGEKAPSLPLSGLASSGNDSFTIFSLELEYVLHD